MKNERLTYAWFHAGAHNYKLLPLFYVGIALVVLVAALNLLRAAAAGFAVLLVVGALVAAKAIRRGLAHYDEVGPDQARSTLARARRYADELKAQQAAREAAQPVIFDAGGTQDSGPSVNVDGTPMVGSVDVKGNPYGVTQISHDPFGH